MRYENYLNQCEIQYRGSTLTLTHEAMSFVCFKHAEKGMAFVHECSQRASAASAHAQSIVKTAFDTARNAHKMAGVYAANADTAAYCAARYAESQAWYANCYVADATKLATRAAKWLRGTYNTEGGELDLDDWMAREPAVCRITWAATDALNAATAYARACVAATLAVRLATRGLIGLKHAYPGWWGGDASRSSRKVSDLRAYAVCYSDEEADALTQEYEWQITRLRAVMGTAT